MHILVDIIHPAHVHFFKYAIALWRERGHKVSITARRKDIATNLLDRYGFHYIDLGAAGIGLSGLAVELIRRNVKLMRLTYSLRPDVLVGIGGIFIAQVGWLRRIPSIVFTDTENATLSNRLTFPFATLICTPMCYEAVVPKAKHLTYAGYHELAYTHRKYFVPDPNVLNIFGLQPQQDFIIVRLVSWGAAHDVSDHGFVDLIETIKQLSCFGRVFISSERELPPELKSYQVSAAPELIHQLLYYARLFIGESATMASESATLGTPAIFVSTSVRGYTNEQEKKYDLTYTFSDPVKGQQQALDKALEILSDPQAKEKWQTKRDRMLAAKIDVTRFIADTVEKYGLEQRAVQVTL
jgi:predicted glycosyltransferase